jgi:hypothetical protein
MDLPNKIRKMLIRTPQYRPLVEAVINRGVNSKEVLSAIEKGLQEKISYWDKQATTASKVEHIGEYIRCKKEAETQLKLIRKGELDAYINSLIPINETICLSWE